MGASTGVRLDPRRRRLDIVDLQIEVHAVLDGLVLRDTLEPEEGLTRDGAAVDVLRRFPQTVDHRKIQELDQKRARLSGSWQSMITAATRARGRCDLIVP